MKQQIKAFSILFIIGFNCLAFSQSNIKGIIKSQNLNEVLPYVNIGIIDKGVGTETNEEGEFELNVLKRHYLDSLKISMIEYFGEGELNFSIALMGSPVIYRNASQGYWTKENLIGPGFNVTVEH